MPKEQTVTVYSYEEILAKQNKSASQRATNWMLETATLGEWWDATYEDIDRAAKHLGIHIANTPKEPLHIYFSGFASQGDGACFHGTWSHDNKPEEYTSLEESIKAYAPTDTTLHDIAKLLDTTKGITASIKQKGRYYIPDITVYNKEDTNTRLADELELELELEKNCSNAMRMFCAWMYTTLRKDYEYLTSDEYLKELAQTNEYLFFIDGRNF